MSLRLSIAIVVSACALRAQGVRLIERIERPIAYLSIDRRANDVGAQPTSDTATADEPPANPLLQLLGDPSLGQLFDGGAESMDPSRAGGSQQSDSGGQAAAARGAFDFVRGVLARAAGEVEFALLAVLPTAAAGRTIGRPLAVVRARLSSDDAARMREVLADRAEADPSRVVAGHQVYRLRGGADAGAPGTAIEAVVVDDDLIAANMTTGLDEALDSGTRAGRRVLASDPRFLSLQKRLDACNVPAGSLRVYADWEWFGSRLAVLEGLSGDLLTWSGIGDAEAVMAALSPRRGADLGLQATVLLSFPNGAAIDGWVGLVEPTSARTLAEELPVGGLGGVVVPIAPSRLKGLPGLLDLIARDCRNCGLDLDKLVGRIGRRGAVQMLLVPDQVTAAAVVPVVAVQAQSKKAAQEIADEIHRGSGDGPRGRRGDGRGHGPGDRPGNHGPGDRGPGDHGPGGRDPGGPGRPPHTHSHPRRDFGDLHLAAVEDQLVFAPDANVFSTVMALRKERSRSRSRIDASVATALGAFGLDRAAKVGGVVHIDFGELLAAVGAGDARRSGAARLLPTKLTGVIDLVDGEASAAGAAPNLVLRLQLLGSR